MNEQLTPVELQDMIEKQAVKFGMETAYAVTLDLLKNTHQGKATSAAQLFDEFTKLSKALRPELESQMKDFLAYQSSPVNVSSLLKP